MKRYWNLPAQKIVSCSPSIGDISSGCTNKILLILVSSFVLKTMTKVHSQSEYTIRLFLSVETLKINWCG